MAARRPTENDLVGEAGATTVVQPMHVPKTGVSLLRSGGGTFTAR